LIELLYYDLNLTGLELQHCTERAKFTLGS